MACIAAAVGWSGSRGMSATNVPIAARRSVARYGATKPRRTRRVSRGRDRANAPSMKPVVRTVSPRSSARDRARRIRVGTREPARLVTAVLVSTTPAQLVPVALRPPQRDRAAPVVGDGDDRSVEVERVGEGAEVVDPRGQPAQLPVRSEKPISSWSTAITRHRPARAATRSRHRYDHVGLPCTHSSVRCASAAVVEDVPGATDAVGVGVRTRRDQAGRGRRGRAGARLAGDGCGRVTTAARSRRRSGRSRCPCTAPCRPGVSRR